MLVPGEQLEQFKFKLEKLLGLRNLKEKLKLEKVIFIGISFCSQ